MHELVTIVANYLIIVPVLVWCWLLVRNASATRLKIIVITILGAIVTAILVKIATTLHQDPRPFIRDGVTPYFSSAKDNGFPSDHTVFATLLAVIIFRFNRVLGIPLILIGLVIGASRVIAGVHHGQDIIGGFLIALLGASLAIAIEYAWGRRYGNRPNHIK